MRVGCSAHRLWDGLLHYVDFSDFRIQYRTSEASHRIDNIFQPRHKSSNHLRSISLMGPNPLRCNLIRASISGSDILTPFLPFSLTHHVRHLHLHLHLHLNNARLRKHVRPRSEDVNGPSFIEMHISVYCSSIL